jgi:hypothetical protein
MDWCRFGWLNDGSDSTTSNVAFGWILSLACPFSAFDSFYQFRDGPRGMLGAGNTRPVKRIDDELRDPLVRFFAIKSSVNRSNQELAVDERRATKRPPLATTISKLKNPALAWIFESHHSRSPRSLSLVERMPDH